MTDTGATDIRQVDGRSGWVRLRTLTNLRWIALVGQLGTVAVAGLGLGFQIDIGPVLAAIGALVVVNLLALALYPRNVRPSAEALAAFLLFDVAQLAVLLFLTGGLNNPFAMLILAPVIIAATALPLRLTIAVGGTAVVAVSALLVWHVPLVGPDGRPLELPPIVNVGLWSSIVIGAGFFAAYVHRVAGEITTMSEALMTTQLALAREQKMTDLAGVISATAHELGTPLATIKLASGELAGELQDKPELAEDARLIHQQADRCSQILQSMGRVGKDDPTLHFGPLIAVLREAAEPHVDRNRAVHIQATPTSGASGRQPDLARAPEIVHGLRNLIQNAVDFAASTVWVRARWSPDRLTIRISDDGAGFSSDVLARIGDPFVRTRRAPADPDARPGYQGMGMGLFIAKTLLERTGANLVFANGGGAAGQDGASTAGEGAVVEVSWPRGAVDRPAGAGSAEGDGADAGANAGAGAGAGADNEPA